MEHKLHNRILSALLALVLVLTGFPVAAFAEGESTDVPESALCEVCGEEPCICLPEAEEDAADAEMEAAADFAIFCDGLAVSTLELCRSEKHIVTAENLPEGCTHQWQIYVPGASFWVNISGQTGGSLDLSFALLGNLLDESDTALVRCAALCDGTVTETSGVLSVAVVDDPVAEEVSVEETPVEEAPAEEEPEIELIAPVPGLVFDAATLAEDETSVYFTITIDYLYGPGSKFAGQRVSTPYVEEIIKGGAPKNASVESPVSLGYKPEEDEVDLSFITAIDQDHSLVVYYEPDEVSYTVRHYQQNVADNEYTWVDTTMFKGYTEALTSDAAAETYDGFTALKHFHEEIAADSSTMIDIYYDRNYYLMTFNLDEGHGVDPIYARFGAPISISDPEKTGWVFAGWVDEEGNPVSIPTTMPAENTTFTATWTAKTGISFTVAYWLEDANTDKKYNFWVSTTQTANAGATVQGEDYKDYTKYLDPNDPDDDPDTDDAMDTYEMRYSYYDHADTDVVIKGDGSTVVNVYYKRNEYTLKFYYAQEDTTNSKYYVIGGSTYRFGASATISDTGSEVALLDHYMYSYASERGEVDEVPSLNSVGSARSYTVGSDTSTVNNVNYKYHYISFKAKYGEDISALWPCGVFDSVTRKGKDDTNGWSGVEAFVSAWNGEHHVFYSQHNVNQTIKGNYNELDYQLLFDYCGTHNYTDSPTVAYLCFWENGANIRWSVPELYRYNIYVPVLTGQEANQTDDGQYYLWATYDTCDNSTVGEQTAPAINGYTYTGKYSSVAISDYDTSLYSEAYEVNFFYTRDQYKLTFVNGDTKAQEGKMYFGADISNMAPTVTCPKDEPENYDFSGWCTASNTVAGSEYTLTTMPANNLILYAKWTLKTRTVKIYASEDELSAGNQSGADIQVMHDSWVPEESRPYTKTVVDPDDSSNTYEAIYVKDADGNEVRIVDVNDESAAFIGWFYKDGTEEKAFDFDNMTIRGDMQVYAKWRSEQVQQVSVRYVYVDSEGNEIEEIADTEYLTLRIGQTRTFDAKTGNSLYEGFREGYFPTAASHSITPAEDSTAADLNYTFTYKKYGTVPYQVEFYVQLDADNDGKLDLRAAFKKDENGKAVFVTAEEYADNPTYDVYIEQHWQNSKAVVVELYVPDDLADATWTLPDAYLPDNVKVQKVIVPSTTEPETNITANTIQFIYTYKKPTSGGDTEDETDDVYESKYLVQHYIQNLDYLLAADDDKANYEEYVLNSFVNYTGLSGDVASASPVSILGYTYSADVTSAKMTEYNGTRAEGNENSLSEDSAVMSGTITADDSLELNFYYTLNQYPYQVLYLESGTNAVLQEAKTVDSEGNALKGYYNARVTEKAVGISGYNVDADSKSIYIKMEADENTASVNTIVFYYTRMNADLIISKQVALDETQAKEEGIDEIPYAALTQEFTFTVTNTEGFYKSVYDGILTTVSVGEDGTTSYTVDSVKLPAGTTEMTFTLKHGQALAIQGLAMGTYTITETYVPGFRISIGDDSDAKQFEDVSIDAKLATDGEQIDVKFLNSYPFYVGDLVLQKTVSKLDKDDPAPTGDDCVYKVTVKLTPAPETRSEVDREITWTNGDDTTGSFVIPALTGTEEDETVFTISDILVPVDGSVTLKGVPAGTFVATEEVKGNIGYIADFYTVTYDKETHKNDTATGRSHEVSGVIHGGHATEVTFNNTYKKGDLTINKTVTQEYENDNWGDSTFEFNVTGITELPAGTYRSYLGGDAYAVSVSTDSEGNKTIAVAGNAELDAGVYDAYVRGQVVSASVDESGAIAVAMDLELADGDYLLYLGGKTIDVTVKTVTEMVDGNAITKNVVDMEVVSIYVAKGTSGTEWTGSQTIHGLPAGYYTVTEKEDVAYYAPTAVYNPKTGLVNDIGTPAVVTITNTYKRTAGNLQVSKEIEIVGEGHSIDDTQEFVFTVELTDGTLVGPYSYSLGGNSGTLSVSDSKLTFKLKHGESIRIDGLPVGEYRVTETQITGYASYFDDATTAAEIKTATIETNKVTKISVINKYPVNCGTLVVNKVVVTPSDRPTNVDQAPSGDKADTFTFTVVISNYSGLINLEKFVVAQFSEGSIGTCDVDNDTRTIEFTLRDGESVELTLPVCSYTITEASLEDYTAKFEPVGDANGKIVSGEKETITVTNTYKRHYGNLVISQCGMTNPNESGIYELLNSSGDVVVTLMITGNRSVTVEQVPLDTYTVREICTTEGNPLDWTWAYSPYGDPNTNKTPEVTVSENGKEYQVTFKQSPRHVDWLRCEAIWPQPSTEEESEEEGGSDE